MKSIWFLILICFIVGCDVNTHRGKEAWVHAPGGDKIRVSISYSDDAGCTVVYQDRFGVIRKEYVPIDLVEIIREEK